MTVPSFFTRVGRFFFFLTHTYPEYDMCIFEGEGTVDSNPRSSSPLDGERCPILVFCRQERGTEPNFEGAISVAERVGFVNVDLNQGGVGKRRVKRNTSEEARKARRLAWKHGSAVVAYIAESKVVFCP